ncbi:MULTISPECIES: hypothetical protein [Flavobacteriaceae]|uniref:hypothetical protein n=1 Tax=Flavobacteriaceae TaxID=49546 RepID=UPI0010AE1E32|nr:MULTISPECIES: hypothetical protein [Flavobacteriaceae]NJB38069.1 hypothetical protein [Croceivirga sp. JEA036]TKD54159.1 hypothetical protein FBT53_16010 [Flavobacterium sp. ASW18X]
MKAILRNLTVVAIMFATVASFAKGPETTFGGKVNEVEKNLMAVKLDPIFKKKGNKLFMNLLNLDQQDVTIKVYDSEGRVVFKEILEGELVIEKAFNFENAFENDYTVVVVDNQKSFKETVVVK